MTNFFKIEKLADSHSALFVGDNAYAISKAQALGFELDSVEDVARKRIELGQFHQISWTGSRTTASLVYDDGGFFLTTVPAYSPLYDSQAQENHAMTLEHPYSGVDPRDLQSFIELPSESFDIGLDQLIDSPIAHMLFGDQLEPYQNWLAYLGIEALPFTLPPMSLAKHHPDSFIRPLVIRCTDNWSGFVAVNDLHHPYGTRATAREFEDATLVSAEESFSVEQLSPVIAILGIEERSYTFRELQAHAKQNYQDNIFGVALRIIRQGNLLPASHATFLNEADRDEQ